MASASGVNVNAVNVGRQVAAPRYSGRIVRLRPEVTATTIRLARASHDYHNSSHMVFDNPVTLA